MKPVAARVKGIQPSPTVRIGTLARDIQAKGQRVENLSIGEPDFPTPAHIVEAARRALGDVPMTKYVSSSGSGTSGRRSRRSPGRRTGSPRTRTTSSWPPRSTACSSP